MENAPDASAPPKFLPEQLVTVGQLAFGGFQHLLCAFALDQRTGVTLLRGPFALLAQDADRFEWEAESFHNLRGCGLKIWPSRFQLSAGANPAATSCLKNRFSGAFDNWPDVLAAMARRGYVVAAVTYRFSGEAPSPAAPQDVKAAIRWLRANAAKFRIDKTRFVTLGGSAGGQLSGLVATSCDAAAFAPAKPAGAGAGGGAATVEHPVAGAADPALESDCVQGAVAWYGIFDFRTMPGAPPERAYLGCKDTVCTEAQQLAASAVHYLDGKSPPMLLIAGAEDHLVPPRQSIDFHAAMMAAGIRSDLLIIPGVDHSFIGKTADDTRSASRLALARTIDFIDSVIGDR